MKNTLLYKSSFMLVIAIVLFILAYGYGNSTFISMAMAWLGCTIGGIIGVWIKERKNIKSNKKLTKELFIFFLLAIILSVIWYSIMNEGDLQWIGVIAISIISIAIVAIRNKIFN